MQRTLPDVPSHTDRQPWRDRLPHYYHRAFPGYRHRRRVFRRRPACPAYVELADEAIHIGESPAAQSYLLGERIIEAAQRSGAQAIHPGYGFLSENAGFARLCERRGWCLSGHRRTPSTPWAPKHGPRRLWVRPVCRSSRAITAMTRVMTGCAGKRPLWAFPCYSRLPPAVAARVCARSTRRGIRRALAAARRESAASFGDDRMLVEKLIQRPRHVEIQVFCDATRQCAVSVASATARSSVDTRKSSKKRRHRD
jgi:3-methylcrotonyl-CoA carboxylase alpha subunit